MKAVDALGRVAVAVSAVSDITKAVHSHKGMPDKVFTALNAANEFMAAAYRGVEKAAEEKN